MARKLAAQVVLLGDDGEPVTYAANTSPPADVAKQITNPAAWQDDDGEGDEPTPEPTKRAPRKAAKKAAASKADEKKPAGADGATSSEVVPADDAGDEAWRAYAATVGVTVADDADSATVKADLADRGLLEP
ncbi:MAG: hypothetical protein JWP11_1906 [Frankiales bacterium]|nr:hypothetical protein [Frankiales bacterium]